MILAHIITFAAHAAWISKQMCQHYFLYHSKGKLCGITISQGTLGNTYIFKDAHSLLSRLHIWLSPASFLSFRALTFTTRPTEANWADADTRFYIQCSSILASKTATGWNWLKNKWVSLVIRRFNICWQLIKTEKSNISLLNKTLAAATAIETLYIPVRICIILPICMWFSRC